ncbi:MAG: DUF502 domain-containing protein [Candidatus Melainabacteria bacterium]|nr:MAG: DUF502 domain-containing protein [Candidatus Melainabacteria bacterium]
MSKSSKFSGYLFRGVVFLAAPAVTLWAVQYAANFADQFALLGQFVRFVADLLLPDFLYNSPFVQMLFPYLSLALAAGVATWFGILASYRIGKEGLRVIDYIFFAIPGIRFIFTNVKNVLEIFDSDKPKFTRSVAFRYAGQIAYGFASSYITDKVTGKKFVVVFMPLQFVPPSGFQLVIPEDEVWDTGMTSQETIRAVVTMGGITPDAMNLVKPDSK